MFASTLGMVVLCLTKKIPWKARSVPQQSLEAPPQVASRLPADVSAPLRQVDTLALLTRATKSSLLLNLSVARDQFYYLL